MSPAAGARLPAWLFRRLLALCYLAAFASLLPQLRGLVGENGLLPISDLLGVARERFGSGAWRLLPTLAWIDPSGSALVVQAAAGIVVSLAVLAGLVPAAGFALLFVLWLSLVVAGQDFLGFQWDALLLEAGFLAIFLSPLSLRDRPTDAGARRVPVLLLRFLLFRVMLSSGLVKLLSGDVLWRDLLALTVHYETQPLPTPAGWWAHQFPVWFQKASCLGMFAIELVAPCFVFGPRRLRLAAFAILTGFQFLIALTGNYAYFNVLTFGLGVLLLDDAVFAGPGSPAPVAAPAWPRAVVWPVAAVLALLSVAELGGLAQIPSPAPVESLVALASPFRIVNGYGLFAVMTNPRPEIVLEGSADGTLWEPYELPEKPGDILRAPRFVAPGQPRLDWQMWFAALSLPRAEPWLTRLGDRLVHGEPDVLALFSRNPFPGRPPRFVRGSVFVYRFTARAERGATGAWWKRDPIGTFPLAERGGP